MPSPARLTPDDLLRLPKDGFPYELIGGELRERLRSVRDCHVAGQVLAAIGDAEPNGWVCPSTLGYRCFPDDPDRVRRADVTSIAAGRLTQAQAEADFCPVAPDSAVRMVTPRDTAGELGDEVADWLAAGTRAVWLIDAAAETVRVYAADTQPCLLGDPEMLPGLSIPVAALFRTPA